MVNIYKKSKK